MSYIPIEARLGIQPIGLSSAVQNHDLGTLLRARDPVYGEGEFIYLKGVLGTVIGSVVTWSGESGGAPTYQTALAPASATLNEPVAVAMSANVANQYGWYQIGGQAVVATNGILSANAAVYLAGSGQLTSSAAASAAILNAVSITASGTPSSGKAVVEIDRPFVGGTLAQTVGTIRKPASAATVAILTSDIEVGLDTRTTAVSATLPSVAAWSTANPNGLELTLNDYYGNAAANNITPSLFAGDSFAYGGVTPKILSDFGVLKLRPDPTATAWVVRGVN